jgi:hypothetical protein
MIMQQLRVQVTGELQVFERRRRWLRPSGFWTPGPFLIILLAVFPLDWTGLASDSEFEFGLEEAQLT